MRFLTRSSLLISLALAAELSAQSDVAFVALRGSHLGALTPLITPAMISRRLNGAQLGLRYGFREEFDLSTQAVALSGIFGLGLSSSVALTAGVTDADCFSCSPALMLGRHALRSLRESRVRHRRDHVGLSCCGLVPERKRHTLDAWWRDRCVESVDQCFGVGRDQSHLL